MTAEPDTDTPTEELRYRTTPAAAAEIRELVAAALGRIERGEQYRRYRWSGTRQSLPLRPKQPGTRADGPVGETVTSSRPRRSVTSRPRTHCRISAAQHRIQDGLKAKPE